MSRNSLGNRTLSSVSNNYKSNSKSKSKSNPTPTPKSNKSKGGVNLTPLISALLLAGIKLSLEQNKKAKKNTDASKSAKSKRRPKTV
jgi:hypothetical protein